MHPYWVAIVLWYTRSTDPHRTMTWKPLHPTMRTGLTVRRWFSKALWLVEESGKVTAAYWDAANILCLFLVGSWGVATALATLWSILGVRSYCSFSVCFSWAFTGSKYHTEFWPPVTAAQASDVLKGILHSNRATIPGRRGDWVSGCYGIPQ